MGKKRTTFAEVGLDFPLWKAPISSSDSIRKNRLCELCGTKSDYLFVFAERIIKCTFCGTTNGIHPADDRADCWTCGGRIPKAPYFAEGDGACYSCYRTNGTMGHQTNLGYLHWEVPVKRTNPETSTTFVFGVNGIEAQNETQDTYAPLLTIQEPWLWELMRTPSIATRNECAWQICTSCHIPATYLGGTKENMVCEEVPGKDRIELCVSDPKQEDHVHIIEGNKFQCLNCSKHYFVSATFSIDERT